MQWTKLLSYCYHNFKRPKFKPDNYRKEYWRYFTPRKSKSIWSVINIKKAEELKKSGLMTPEGQKAFDLKTENRSGIYSHETVNFNPNYEIQFKNNKLAWDFFNEQPPSYAIKK